MKYLISALGMFVLYFIGLLYLPTPYLLVLSILAIIILNRIDKAFVLKNNINGSSKLAKLQPNLNNGNSKSELLIPIIKNGKSKSAILEHKINNGNGKVNGNGNGHYNGNGNGKKKNKNIIKDSSDKKVA